MNLLAKSIALWLGATLLNPLCFGSNVYNVFQKSYFLIQNESNVPLEKTSKNLLNSSYLEAKATSYTLLNADSLCRLEKSHFSPYQNKWVEPIFAENYSEQIASSGYYLDKASSFKNASTSSCFAH